MSMKHCSDCKKDTYHHRQNSGGEIASKVLLGVLSMGMSVGITPTVYECGKCGKERE